MNKFFSYIIIIVIIIVAITDSNAQQPTYNLYYTDMIAADLSHHCLYFIYDQSTGLGGKISIVEQTIEYCFRPILKKLVSEIPAILKCETRNSYYRL